MHPTPAYPSLRLPIYPLLRGTQLVAPTIWRSHFRAGRKRRVFRRLHRPILPRRLSGSTSRTQPTTRLAPLSPLSCVSAASRTAPALSPIPLLVSGPSYRGPGKRGDRLQPRRRFLTAAPTYRHIYTSDPTREAPFVPAPSPCSGSPRTMSSSPPPTPPSPSYLEQTASLLSTVASYMRLPALASTVCATRLCFPPV